jgi:hypothetical protein
MGVPTNLGSVFRAVLTGVSFTSLVACACPESRVVIAIRDDQVPLNASVSPTSRELSSEECRTLCGTFSRECKLVLLCNSTSASSCVGFAPPPSDAGAVDGGDGGAPPSRLFSMGVECVVTNACIGGRRPEGFAVDCPSELTSVGAYLARQGALEGASVPAFARLADELAWHGAPPSLVARAREALRDEVSHVGILRALAAREGFALDAHRRADDRARRSLERMAVENAVEGCVRETFAALVAVRQGESAADPSIRAGFAAIARDETRHAELSLSVHEWALEWLDDARRADVRRAMREAIDALREECAAASDAESAREGRRALGLPSATEMLAMLDGLERALWASLVTEPAQA